MDFQQNHFELFRLPVSFSVDLNELGSRYRELQKSVHPDRFAGGSDQNKRLSVQWATRINEAYDTLKSPLPRAIYMLKLAGLEIAHNPSLDPAFLMEQIELREELEDIGEDEAALAQLDVFRRKVNEVLASLEATFEAEVAADLPAAEQTVYKMQFMNKLRTEANHLEEKLLDY
ncbi:MAG: Fe-S protein assembly co-chaperone HscB [Pseudomonadales bacterium]|nr:Fe-S protein assembly co-chaperone HscB [Pseudomonadales bacterium]